jgi:Flp pilus assembly protein TadG
MRIFNRDNLKRFKQDVSGNIGMIFGLTFIPLMLAVGVAVDSINVVTMNTKMTKALDAAVLAVAASPSSMSKKDRETLGEKTFYANFSADWLNAASGKPKFKITGEKVEGFMPAVVDTSLMGLAGIDTVNVNVGAEVSIKEKKTAEIALVLDYSWSMDAPPESSPGGEAKYEAMQKAAIKLVDDLVAVDKDKVKVGLVPFSHYVMVPLPAAFVKDASYTGTRLVCTQDRPNDANITDATPVTSDDDTKWGQPDIDTDGRGCAEMVSNRLEVKPLSTDFKAIKDQLKDMRPFHRTHVALGAEFGFHLLSPNAPFDNGAEYDDSTVEKFLVILTDGRQTVGGFGPDGIRTWDQGRKNLGSICKAAKDKGIRVITIAYDLRNQETRDSLANCASDAAKFFIADDNQQIAAAFDSIKRLLLTEFYISK